MPPMLKGLLALLLFLVAGELLRALLHLPIPGNVIGMLLLAAALGTGLVSVETVKPTADFLVRNMALFFVPAGVAVVRHLDALRAWWLPIVAAAIPSTFAVLAVVGLLQQRGRR
ncbi:CidA/LrgA family protein [Vulgatibacter sp.]|uniref:CidA/LrgA family protein n=1 Tax=Vulgatibacter sp. TaxID=1971226 RepID=UPI003564F119